MAFHRKSMSPRQEQCAAMSVNEILEKAKALPEAKHREPKELLSVVCELIRKNYNWEMVAEWMDGNTEFRLTGSQWKKIHTEETHED